jgi:hypothetical protein
MSGIGEKIIDFLTGRDVVKEAEADLRSMGFPLKDKPGDEAAEGRKREGDQPQSFPQGRR